jgi:hypothetical protein
LYCVHHSDGACRGITFVPVGTSVKLDYFILRQLFRFLK